jgi:hypothetical protein
VTSLVDKILAVHHSLKLARIDHAFGGALALAYCTRQPRATSDIDVNIFIRPEEAPAALAALPFHDADNEGATRAIERDGQARLWWDDTPVDVFFSYHAFHDRASQRTHVVPFGAESIPILDCTDLAVFKALFARTKDWADVEAMAEAGSVDGADAVRTVADLLGAGDAAVARLEAALTTPTTADEGRLRHALGAPAETCAEWMPVAGRACHLAAGHRGQCR